MLGTSHSIKMKNNKMKNVLTYTIIGLSFFACTKDRVLPDIPPPTVGEMTVIGYWHFNQPSSPIELMTANIAANTGFLRFHGSSGELAYCNGANVSCFEEVSDGTELNMLEGSSAGAALRLRNPCTYLDIEINTQNYRDLKLSYAVKRTGSGAQINEVHYSSDGVTFITAGLSDNEFVITEDYELVSIDLSNAASLNNNASARIRIMFMDGNNNSSGNNRIDNLMITAKAL